LASSSDATRARFFLTLAVVCLASAHEAGARVLITQEKALAEAFPVPIERVESGETSFANLFIVTAAVIYGWQAAVLIGVLSMLIVELFSRKSPVRMAYNASLYALAALAAGAVAAPLSEQYRTGLLSSLAFYVVDVALVGAAIALARRRSYPSILRSFYLSTLAPFVVMASTTAVLVQLWRQSPWWSLLIVPPLVAIGLHQRSLVATVTRQRELEDRSAPAHAVREPDGKAIEERVRGTLRLRGRGRGARRGGRVPHAHAEPAGDGRRV